jgi:hypothetical protein
VRQLNDDDDLFDPYEQALLRSESDVGIVIGPDEQMHLVGMNQHVVTECVGDTADTLTARGGVVFWFRPMDRSPEVNRMATLNLFAAAGMSARTVRLLHGPVLITGADEHGNPTGLSNAQFKLLKSGPEPNWWAKRTLQVRARRFERRRSRRPR